MQPLQFVTLARPAESPASGRANCKPFGYLELLLRWASSDRVDFFLHPPIGRGGKRSELPLVTIVQAQSIVGRGEIATAFAVLAAIGCLAWWRGRRRLAGTTLLAPGLWTLAALVIVAGSEAALAISFQPDDARLTHWRFLAAAVLFCPTMAVLGAKRPQDRAWQWVVASLWLVIAWPAIEALVYRPDRPLVLHATRQWFMALLLAMEAFNVLGTRRALAGLLWIAVQTILLHEHLPFLDTLFASSSSDTALVLGDPSLGLLANLPLIAVATLTASVVLTACDWPRRRKQPGDPWTAVWLDFRDEFGTIWSLRVAERFNSAAALCDWNLRLRWSGPQAADAGRPADRLNTSPAARQSLLQLLRRFVSPAWLAQRGVDVNQEA